MPGFTTHYILGSKTYQDMPSCTLKHIIARYRWLYQIGLQGPDMFFYNIPLLRHRDYRNVGVYMHEAHVNAFFSHALDAASRLHSTQQKAQAFSFIAGFMSHYIGDYICHPYVYGRIKHNPYQKSAYTYGLHAALENDIDTLLLHKYKKKKPSAFNQAATISLNGFEMQFICDFLSKVINKTYYPLTYRNSYQVTPAMIHRSIVAMRFGVITFADPSGKKKNSIGKVENLLLKSPIVSHKILSDTVEDVTATLNLNHEVWLNPWDLSKASKASFPELFKQALIKSEMVFYALNKDIGHIKHIHTDFHRVLGELGNYSYHSGLDVGKEKR